MKRYPSIDFLRGLAIFLMVYLHTFMRWFDRNTFIAQAFSGSGVPLFFVVLLVMSLFFGSWAGFFLMVSAMGNMISMYKGLEKGQSPKDLIIKQVIGGFILLFFAYLSEGLIGYHGSLGELIVGHSDPWSVWLHRGYHMETIHAVAWCVIINGIVQGLMSINDGWKKITRNIRIYAVLAVVVILVTQFVWWGFDSLVGGNFSLGNDPRTGQRWQQGYFGILPWYENLFRIFWQPWAGEVEPLFPFLSVSFIGSIIALALIKRSMEPERKDVKELKKGIAIGTIMAFSGAILVIIFALTSGVDPLDYILNLLSNGYSIPAVEDIPTFAPLGFLVWLPYFILLTGSQLGAICLIIRLVEFRGKGKKFAEKTLFYRRFGFVAFSIYNYQFIDVLPILFLSLFPIFPAFHMNSLGIWQIWFAVILIFALWYVVLALWEKVDYALGLEWCIAKLSAIFIPMKRSESREKLPWWKTPRLDPKASLHDAEWIDIIPEDQIDHKNLSESVLARKIAYCGIVFFPCFFVALGMVKNSVKTEGVNKYNTSAKRVGIIGSIVFGALMIVLASISTSVLF